MRDFRRFGLQGLIFVSLILFLGGSSCKFLEKLSVRVTGTVYADGAPVPYVRVDLEKDGKPVYQVSTNDRGYFTFEQVSPGEYAVKVVATAGSIKYGDPGVTIKVMPGKTVQKDINVTKIQ